MQAQPLPLTLALVSTNNSGTQAPLRAGETVWVASTNVEGEIWQLQALRRMPLPSQFARKSAPNLWPLLVKRKFLVYGCADLWW